VFIKQLFVVSPDVLIISFLFSRSRRPSRLEEYQKEDQLILFWRKFRNQWRCLFL
jgi:hypothetical protein